MKRTISFLLVCLVLCGNAFSANNYTIVDMSMFADVGEFGENLCATKDKATGRWGFVDTNKKWVIAPQFKNASYFKNGFCAVTTADSETVLIDRTGKIFYKCLTSTNRADTRSLYVEKHGTYYMIIDKISNRARLMDEKYKDITPDDVDLYPISETFYGVRSEQGTGIQNGKAIFNYKGQDITRNLASENVDFRGLVYANNKYIVYSINGEIKCFDINGKKVAEFNGSGEIKLDGNLIMCNKKVFNIAIDKTVFEDESINIQEIRTYYSKYFTVKKQNGTSALYASDGKIMVDFGKWDYIFPSSVSSNIVVSIGDKYGIVDINGKYIMPLEYSINPVWTADKNPMQYGYISNTGKFAVLTKGNQIIFINMGNLKTHKTMTTSDIFTGYKYHRVQGTVLDDQFNLVYSDSSIISGSADEIKNGIISGAVKRVHSRNPMTYDFVIFADSGVKVELDGKRIEFDVLPVIKNGRTLVPMRAIFEELGAQVDWEGTTQTITAKGKDVTIKMQIGSNILIKNGEKIVLDVEPQLVGGRTMVPVRAVSDSFNVLVDWNNYLRTVLLYTN